MDWWVFLIECVEGRIDFVIEIGVFVYVLMVKYVVMVVVMILDFCIVECFIKNYGFNILIVLGVG